jgi:hypothetical protein
VTLEKPGNLCRNNKIGRKQKVEKKFVQITLWPSLEFGLKKTFYGISNYEDWGFYLDMQLIIGFFLSENT